MKQHRYTVLPNPDNMLCRFVYPRLPKAQHQKSLDGSQRFPGLLPYTLLQLQFQNHGKIIYAMLEYHLEGAHKGISFRCPLNSFWYCWV